MVLASHVIFGAYGFWLPNDPRGSWSDFVGSWDLYRFGSATKTNVIHSVAARPHDRTLRLKAKEALQHPAVNFNDEQAREVAVGFADYAARSQVVVFACSIMPDHVHLVIAAHRLNVEVLVVQLKGAATKQLIQANVHPFAEENAKRPKCFAQGLWKVFLNDASDIHRAIAYVENNPLKAGKPKQVWQFVTPYIPALGYGNPPPRG